MRRVDLTEIPHLLNFQWAVESPDKYGLSKAPINIQCTDSMSNKRKHVVLAEKLVKDIDRLVGPRRRSTFLTEAAEEKLMRLRQIAALKAAAGAWKDQDHPELKQGSEKWVRKLRRETERRFKKVTAR